MPEAHHPDTKKQGGTSKGRGKRKIAFTLAEVLITLGIIGIVAAMTLPTLIQNNKEKETVSKLKKVYSVLQQAQLGIIQEYGTFNNLIDSNTDTGERDENNFAVLDYTSTNYIKNLFEKQLKVIKNCESGKNCLKKPIYKLNGTKIGSYNDPLLVLSDGTTLFFGWSYSSCSKTTICTEIGVALPVGTRDHYTLGRDIFYFKVLSDRIIPQGTTKGNLANTDCNRTSNGHNCAAWVIFNENMDYLHCDNLSWNGKKKCK